MSKYELALVVNAKIEDDERTAVVDKCKALIERFGGTITNVDDWGKEEACLRDPEDERGLLLFHPVRRRDFRSCGDREPCPHHGQRNEIFSCKA